MPVQSTLREIETDLRVVFYIERELVVTIDIGSHDIYRA